MYLTGVAFFCVCYLLYVVSQSFLFISIASGYLAVVCTFLLVRDLLNGKIIIMRILCYTTLLTYFIPLIYYPAVAEYIFLSPDELADAAGLILTAVTIGFGVSGLLHQKIDLFDLPGARSITTLFPLIALVQLGMIVTGTWRYGVQGVDAAFGEEMSPVVMLGLALSPPVMLVGAFQLGRMARVHGLRSRIVMFSPLVGVLLVQCVWWALVSRRAFGGEAVLSMILFGAGYLGGGLTRRHLVFFAFSSIALIPAILLTWQIFFFFRVASYEYIRQGQMPSLTDLFDASANLDEGEVSSQLSQNLYSRPFIIESLATFRVTSSDFLYGFGLVMNVVNSVPSAVLPIKSDITQTYGTGETLWSRELGTDSERDFANSLMLDGYVDFGVFGFTIYALVVHLLGTLFVSVTRRYIGATVATYLTMSIVSQTFQIEGQLSAWLNLMRSIAALALVFYVLRLLLTKRQGGSLHRRAL